MFFPGHLKSKKNEGSYKGVINTGIYRGLMTFTGVNTKGLNACLLAHGIGEDRYQDLVYENYDK